VLQSRQWDTVVVNVRICVFLGFCHVSPPVSSCGTVQFAESCACAYSALLALTVETRLMKGLDNFASRTKSLLPLHSECSQI